MFCSSEVKSVCQRLGTFKLIESDKLTLYHGGSPWYGAWPRVTEETDAWELPWKPGDNDIFERN